MSTVIIVTKYSILGYFRNYVNNVIVLRRDYIRATRFDPRCVLFCVLMIATCIQVSLV